MRKIRLIVPGIAILLAATPHARAQTYTNEAFGYTVSLPAGWEGRSDPRANPALMVSRDPDVQVRLQASVRDEAAGERAVREVRTADELAVRRRFPSCRPVPATGPPLLAGRPTAHYGFAYRDGRGTVLVARFALASQPAGGRHLWLKLQAVFARNQARPASERLDQLLAGVTVAPARVAGGAAAGASGKGAVAPGAGPPVSPGTSGAPTAGPGAGWASVYSGAKKGQPGASGAARAVTPFLDGFKKRR